MVVICQKLAKLTKNDLTFVHRKDAIDYLAALSSKDEQSKITEKVEHSNP